jgi:REP element-mobilizing transposase RayT
MFNFSELCLAKKSVERLANHTHRYYEKRMQLNFIAGTWAKSQFAFGASLLKGSHPKKKRTFVEGLPMHVVIQSSHAKGARSFFAFNKEIARIFKVQSERHFVAIYGLANSGNHIHLLLLAPSRNHLSAFLKAVTGRIAQLVQGDGHSESFWDARPFSRLVNWGRDFKNVARYLMINVAESLGESRMSVRAMLTEVQIALSKGLLKKTPGLIAAGFG